MAVTITETTNNITVVDSGIPVTVTEAGQTTVTMASETTPIAGPAGADGVDGQGVPIGGTAGQVLTKINGVDYNTEWTNVTDTGNIVYTQASQPGTTVEGDQWFNTLTNTLQTYTSTGWQPLTLDGQNF